MVPGISVTMALSWPDKALSRLDLPALGRPMMASTIPSRSNLPWRASSNRPVSCSRVLFRRWSTSLSARKSISSSGKSMAASTKTRNCIKPVRKAFTRSENTPCRLRCAARAAASVPESIRSAMASAWTRSILSLRKARSENSPGRAARAPSCMIRSSTR